MMHALGWLSLLPIKPFVLLAYGAYGILLLWLAAGRRIRFIALPQVLVALAVGAPVILMSYRFTLHGRLFILCTAIGAAVFALKDRAFRDSTLLLQSVAVVASAVSLAWWLVEAQPNGWWGAVLFALIVWCIQAGFLWKAERSNRWVNPALFILFAALGFALLADTTEYQPNSEAFATLIHHQGAYLGSAFHIRAGLVPYYDVPLQYGLGPSLLIAATLGVMDCWSGMEFLTVATTLIMGLLILGMALTTKMARGPFWKLAATAVVLVAVFLWPGSSDLGSLPTATPSVGGLRFLPVTLVAFLLFFERHRLASAALVPAVLWSPEVAGMSLAVFCVYETSRVGLIRAVVRAAAIFAASLAGLAIVHHAIYHVWIQPDVMLEYILHVPGPLPINPLSNFLFLAGAFGIAAWNVYRPPADVLAFRRDLVAAALLFAATSYYLGRSHPNNVCNLMPFVALVALRSLDGASPTILPGLPRLAIIGMSTAAGALMLSYWMYVPFQNGFSIDSEPVALAAENLDQDAAYLRLRYAIPDDTGIADMRGMRGSYPGQMTIWTPLDPGSLWLYVPRQRLRLYIQRAAARLHRPGWIIMDTYQQPWLDDLRVAYRVAEIYHGGTERGYVAAHLIPLDQAANDGTWAPRYAEELHK